MNGRGEDRMVSVDYFSRSLPVVKEMVYVHSELALRVYGQCISTGPRAHKSPMLGV